MARRAIGRRIAQFGSPDGVGRIRRRRDVRSIRLVWGPAVVCLRCDCVWVLGVSFVSLWLSSVSVAPNESVDWCPSRLRLSRYAASRSSVSCARCRLRGNDSPGMAPSWTRSGPPGTRPVDPAVLYGPVMRFGALMVRVTSLDERSRNTIHSPVILFTHLLCIFPPQSCISGTRSWLSLPLLVRSAFSRFVATPTVCVCE